MKKTTLKTWLFTRPFQFALRMLLVIVIAWFPTLFFPKTVKKIPLHDTIIIVVWILAMVGIFVWSIYKLIKTLQKQNIPQDNFITVLNKYTRVTLMTLIVVILISVFDKTISTHLQNPIFIILYKSIDFTAGMYLLGVVISEFCLKRKYNQKLKKKDTK